MGIITLNSFSSDTYTNGDGTETLTNTVTLNLNVHLDYDPLELILTHATETGQPQHVFYHVIGQSKEDWANSKEYLSEIFGPNPSDWPYTLDEDKMVAVMEIQMNMNGPGVVVMKNGNPASIVPLGGTYDRE